MNLKLALIAGLLPLLFLGCMYSTTGKVPLSDGKLPPYFQVGKTTPAEVLDRYGEPLVYREYGDRSVMIFEYNHTEAPLLPHEWGIYRIFLVFENGVLKKTDVQKLQWRLDPAWMSE